MVRLMQSQATLQLTGVILSVFQRRGTGHGLQSGMFPPTLFLVYILNFPFLISDMQMAQEYRQRGGGIPDLFLWHSENKEVMFSEVKSENDRLSDTQRLWIHVLTGAGIKVELCNAVARESKT